MMIIQSKLLSSSPVIHGFSNREAGDLAYSQRQHRAVTLAARNRYLTELGASGDKAVFCNQVHGADIFDAHSILEHPGTPCDGLHTSQRGIPLNILTADCIAALFYDPRQHVAAACHAGWQGSAQGIVDACVLRLGERYGTVPQDLLVALGPGAAWCCYEVSYDVLCALGDGGQGIWWREGERGKPMLDLRKYNMQRLQAAGIPLERIEMTGTCSICDSYAFSYRREGNAAGRMMATIELL